MIIDFTVSNYKSIKEPVTLSMYATGLKELNDSVYRSENEKDIGILKSAVVYGANASGKSNLLKAIDSLQEFIVTSTDTKLGEQIRHYKPFALDKKWISKPTFFEIEFIVDKTTRYKYSVYFNLEEILEESLVYYPKGQEATLFHRKKGAPIKFGDYFQGPKRTIEKQLLENNLFLSKGANSNNEILREVYLYFRNDVRFYAPADISSPFSRDFTTGLCKDDESGIMKKNISSFLKIADTGIDHFNIKKVSVDDSFFKSGPFTELPDELKEDFLDHLTYKTEMHHKLYDDGSEVGTVGFDIDEESNGTKRLYDLAGRLLYILQSGAVIIIDELNNSLHPLMTRFLINFFNDPKINKYNAQLIFATHDATLLSPELFRRDQIWFTEKDEFGATTIYSMSEFDYDKVRANIPYDKWYLSGRFGALPIFGSFSEMMKNAKEKKH